MPRARRGIGHDAHGLVTTTYLFNERVSTMPRIPPYLRYAVTIIDPDNGVKIFERNCATKRKAIDLCDQFPKHAAIVVDLLKPIDGASAGIVNKFIPVGLRRNHKPRGRHSLSV